MKIPIHPISDTFKWFPPGMLVEGQVDFNKLPRYELEFNVDAEGNVTTGNAKFIPADPEMESRIRWKSDVRTNHPPTRRQKSKGCNRKTVKWIGIKWYGKPWPKRWRLDLGVPDFMIWRYEPAPGCGCMKWAKDMTNRWKRKIHAVRYA